MGESSMLAPEPGGQLLALYDSSLPRIYGYLLRRCDDRHVAEDLTSQTFLAAVAAVRRDRGCPISEAWLIGIARHKLVDHWRALGRDERLLTAISGGLRETTHDPWDVELDGLRARQVLAEVPVDYRAALTLRYLDGLSVREVATALQRTLHATEGLLVRARAAFRARYEGSEDA